MMSIAELKKKLSSPGDLDSNPETEFAKLAKALLNDFQIEKGDKRYWMTDIEFYLYTDSHRDIITYPRNCEAGMWFFHASGVDISFESKVDLEEHPNKHRLMPLLTKDAVFGGILIRGIVQDLEGASLVDGPMRVCDELFDRFNAFETPNDFPKIIDADAPRNVCVIRDEYGRYGLKENAIEKVKSILYNYCPLDPNYLTREDLAAEYAKFFPAKYRFLAPPSKPSNLRNSTPHHP